MAVFFRKTGKTPMYPWSRDEDMDGVSISDADRENGSPKPGDMIAYSMADKSDRWLVSAEYFWANYERAD